MSLFEGSLALLRNIPYLFDILLRYIPCNFSCSGKIPTKCKNSTSSIPFLGLGMSGALFDIATGDMGNLEARRDSGLLGIIKEIPRSRALSYLSILVFQS